MSSSLSSSDGNSSLFAALRNWSSEFLSPAESEQEEKKTRVKKTTRTVGRANFEQVLKKEKKERKKKNKKKKHPFPPETRRQRQN
mgnify:CR=1 FL=1